MHVPLPIELGVKTDPIEYRYSFDWLFEKLARRSIRTVQLGSFFEIYQLPDAFFHDLRALADRYGIRIASLFTAHRELGGFFRTEAGFETVARRNFERFIEVGAILGAESVGSNPGAVLRDQMATKAAGVRCYVRHMKELMELAADKGIAWLTVEPMSCLAEPPTLPDEMREMGDELRAYHAQNPQTTAQVGYCVDIAHGYADAQQRVVYDHMQLLEASLPYLYELHLKNTDALYNSTFGFNAAERKRGIIDVPAILRWLQPRAAQLPVSRVMAYLEIGGPKLGRDYSDQHLGQALDDSLDYLRQVIESLADQQTEEATLAPASAQIGSTTTRLTTTPVQIAPSMMCADQLNLQAEVQRMTQIGVHALHLDLMDGQFAPNLSMALPQIEALARTTSLPLDVHLMVQDNDRFIGLLQGLRVAQVTVHAESCTHLDRTLTLIRAAGFKAGVALNPHTSAETLRYLLPRLDYVLVMTVNPGFAGQSLVPTAIQKIRDVRQLLRQLGSTIPIAVDGNVSFVNIPEMVAAGADYLVAGTSSLFAKSGSLEENVRRINDAVSAGLAQRP